MTACPVCDGRETTATVRRPMLPVLQNRVYPTREQALNSPTAPLALHTCSTCGFSFNGLFDSSLVVYDEHYDNDVPSTAFMRYYEDLADQLIERFDLSGGVVYDVGCGKGTFLRVLCQRAPGVRGIGIDPSCQPTSEGNFSLIQDVFKREHVTGDARLVLLRHVLEHIDQPVPFLAGLASAAPHAPLFVEVPDLTWIFKNGTFWDFCYEHCNYFTPSSLAYALTRAGYGVREQLSLFSGQFQGIVGRPGRTPVTAERQSAAREVALASTYAIGEDARMSTARGQIERTSGVPVLWGMATKGVVFATLMSRVPLAGGVDINPKKQNRFAPGSGMSINPPDWLVSLGASPTIFIMNSNYTSEIRRCVSELGVVAQFVEL